MEVISLIFIILQIHIQNFKVLEHLTNPLETTIRKPQMTNYAKPLKKLFQNFDLFRGNPWIF